MFMHTGERPFKCNQCPQGFKAQSELTKHQAMHNVMTFQVFPTPQLATIATATAMPVTTTATVVMPQSMPSLSGSQPSSIPSGTPSTLATAIAGASPSTTAAPMFQQPRFGMQMLPMMGNQAVMGKQQFPAGFPRVMPGGGSVSPAYAAFNMNTMNPMASANRMSMPQGTMQRVGQPGQMPGNPAIQQVAMQAAQAQAQAQAAARMAVAQQQQQQQPTAIFSPAGFQSNSCCSRQ